MLNSQSIEGLYPKKTLNDTESKINHSFSNSDNAFKLLRVPEQQNFKYGQHKFPKDI